MLRRRRTCNSDELSHSLANFMCDKETRKKADKQKLSPFPETNGEYVKQNDKRPSQSVKRTNNITKETCENHPPVFIKPSEVVLIEKKMADSIQLPDTLSDTSSLWESVVSWMKSAVEFIGLEATPTAETEPSSIQSRKRPLAESNLISQTNVSRGSRSNQKGRRMSLAPGILERQNRKRERSSEGVGLQMLTTPCKSKKLDDRVTPTTSSRVYSTTSLQKSAQKYKSGEMGLNDLTGFKMADTTNIRIRNMLKKYYNEENDVKQSPSLRRSPRLAAKRESQAVVVPPPPPPVPPPPPPPPPSVPMPPPISLNSNCHGNATPTPSSPSSMSSCTLKQMQKRLRSRMMKKGGMGENKNQDTTPLKKINVKANQWAELQAHKRKMPLEEFIILADQKKNDFGLMLKKLELDGCLSLEDIRSIVEEIQEASQWFSGGSREMKEEFPLYKSLEYKLELMTECVQIQSEMGDILSDTTHIHQRTSYGSPHTRLDMLRSEFVHRHKQWESVLTTNARSWHNACLPVDMDLLSKAKLYLASIVSKYTDIIETESLKVGGVVCSIKSRRVLLVKDALREGLNLITILLAYFSDSCPCVDTGADSGTSPCCLCISSNLEKACSLSEHFVNVCVMEYDGHLKCSKRQEVCEHFQSILKTLGCLKSMVMQFPDLSKQARKSGIMSVLNNSSSLSNSLYTTCVKLIQHIDSQSRLIMTVSPGTAANSREIVLWMMFGCKYVNSVLEVIGTRQANEKGVNDLLQQLQQMEALLPD